MKELRTKLFHILGFDERDPKVLERIDETNMRIAIPMAVYTLVIEYFMYNRMVFLWGLISRKLYHLGFVIISISCVQLLIVSLLYVTGKFRNAKVARASLYFYVIVCFVIGQSIAVYDYSVGKQVFVFLPMVALIFALLLINPIVTVIGAWLSFDRIPDLVNSRVVLSTYVERVLVIFAIMLMIVSVVRWIDQLNSARNASKILLMNDQLTEISKLDELTGIKNRYGLRQDYSIHKGKNLVVVLSDIDDFKFYNDTYGHDIGDEVLKHEARTLCATFGKECVYRFGGDEFVLILPEWDEAKLLAGMEEWRTRFRLFQCDDLNLHLASTAGYTWGYCRDENDLKKMISIADSQLYEGKLSHKGTTHGIAYDFRSKVDPESLKKIESALRSGETDVLTGLPNMMYFRSKAQLTADLLRMEGKQPVVAYFNLVNFKDFNRKFGLEAGDNLLIDFGHLLSKTFRNELVCRFSDDHFVVLTCDSEAEEKINQLEADVGKMGRDSNLTYACGLVELNEKTADISQICDQARKASESIKGNQYYRWYDEEMHQKLEEKEYISDHIGEALSNGWIDIVYQPIIRSVNGYVCGMETLPRWNDPVRGVIEPEVYIPVLEHSQQIIDHDMYVIKHAVNDYLTCKEAGFTAVPLFINLSYRDFDRDEIIDKILEETKQISHDLIHFDLKANAFSQKDSYIQKALNRLSDEGFQLWMDGFGYGYTSLDVLYDFHMHGIKIDIRSLDGICDGTRQSIVIGHLISMCKQMGIATLALGVEKEEEETFLISHGCEYMQGFLYSSIFTFEEFISGELTKQMVLEPMTQEQYYSAIGRIDLSHPARIKHSSALDTVAEEIPAAICEYRNERYHVLRYNKEFIAFLRSIDINDIEIYEALMNSTKNDLMKRLNTLLTILKEKGGWQTINVGSEKKQCTGSFHLISQDPTDGAVSIIGLIVDMRMYQNVSDNT